MCLYAYVPQVILLDADNMPLNCPDRLFDTEQYKAHGNLFWPGARARTHAAVLAWRGGVGARWGQ